MIFVTVGTQLAFDRMVEAVDLWAFSTHTKVFAQVGPGKYKAKHVTCQRFLSGSEFDEQFNKAELVIAHAGMGTILTALAFGKPVIIMPRRAAMGEHRNDHQLATAKRFVRVPGIQVAWDEYELKVLLSGYQVLRQTGIAPISTHAPDSFIRKLSLLING